MDDIYDRELNIAIQGLNNSILINRKAMGLASFLWKLKESC